MKIDIQDIGIAAILICLGATMVIDSQSDAARRAECDKRGGVLRKAEDSFNAEKQCVIVVKATKP